MTRLLTVFLTEKSTDLSDPQLPENRSKSPAQNLIRLTLRHQWPPPPRRQSQGIKGQVLCAMSLAQVLERWWQTPAGAGSADVSSASE